MPKLFRATKPRSPDMLPRYRYSTSAGGWIIVGLSPRTLQTRLPTASGFNLITARVRATLLTLTIVVFIVSGGVAIRLSYAGDPFKNYLSYILPCLAGIFGGLGIFFPRHATGLFWTSAACLTLGLYFYLAVNANIQTVGFVALVGEVVIAAILLYWITLQRSLRLPAGPQGRVRGGHVASLVVLAIAAVLAAITLINLPLFAAA